MYAAKNSLLLEKEGYKVLKAYDGMQALEMVAQQVQLKLKFTV